MKNAPDALEFPRPERVDRMRDGDERPVHLVADAADRWALAARFGLVALDRFEAHGALHCFGDVLRAELVLSAALTQTCVVTLAPVAATIEEPVVLTFAHGTPEPAAEIDVDAEGDDPPEPIVEGYIELGEPVAEAFGLALDPYPRAPGAAFEGVPDQADPEPGPDTPFAVLERLKR